ncbi:MAG TPA: phosphatase PAP2 family protein [Mycobacteriales bacterium]|jgi:undecaprenyl-diphosphatase|nr:phosphatase PAP2 family protein [Mycobacteriales bacterium]
MRSRTPAVAVIAGTAVFVVLTVLVWAGTTNGVDAAVARFAARHQTSGGLTAARVLTDLFSPGVDVLALLGGAGVLSVRQRRARPVVVAVCAVVAVSALVLTLKDAIDRPLPHSNGQPDQGFPSGHTAATACFLGVLALLASRHSPRLRRRLLIAVAAGSLIVALALVSAGFHWLTDTVASLGLGVAVVGALLLDRLGRALIDP